MICSIEESISISAVEGNAFNAIYFFVNIFGELKKATVYGPFQARQRLSAAAVDHSLERQIFIRFQGAPEYKFAPWKI
jgi:hypothetical protein